jgi:hypothetical protein
MKIQSRIESRIEESSVEIKTRNTKNEKRIEIYFKIN